MELCLTEIGSPAPRRVSSAPGNSIFLFLSLQLSIGRRYSTLSFLEFHMHRIGDRLLVKVRLTSDNEIVAITFASRQEGEGSPGSRPANSDGRSRASRHFSPFSKSYKPVGSNPTVSIPRRKPRSNRLSDRRRGVIARRCWLIASKSVSAGFTPCAVASCQTTFAKLSG